MYPVFVTLNYHGHTEKVRGVAMSNRDTSSGIHQIRETLRIICLRFDVESRSKDKTAIFSITGLLLLGLFRSC